ncbi:MAG: RNA ligase family protein [Kofleriaceae bacterium]|nr:RNA ligase family protein [Kofleriaceae bacterium]MCL4227578.1 DNA ligase [Myxococcales bacterium]
MSAPFHKYPRTAHLEGSRLQPGDADLAQVPLAGLRGRHVVIEEKLDGANAGIAEDGLGGVRLQSRGHVLTGGPRERHFDLFKRWAGAHAALLTRLCAGGLTIYGEWLYAKHTIFYDALPHYFLEFDVRDPDGVFWSTERRRAHLAACGAAAVVRSVPVLWQGVVEDERELPGLVARARYKSPRWRERLAEVAAASGVAPERAALETDPADLAEGLYVKVEEDGAVVARLKWIRASFLTSVVDSGSHWLARPIVPNQLAPGVDLFAPEGDGARS